MAFDVGRGLACRFHINRGFALRVSDGALGEHDRDSGHIGTILQPTIATRGHRGEKFVTIVIVPPDDGFVIDGRAHADDLAHGKEAIVDDVFDLAFELLNVDRGC